MERGKLQEVPIRCEADYYGASLLVAREIGLHSAPVSRSSWVHGCDVLPVPRPAFTPMQDDPEMTHLVANQRTADWWIAHGYTKAIAVGCPFVYTQPSRSPRVANSVLAMPNHRPKGVKSDGNSQDAWLRKVADLQPQYQVTISVYQDELPELLPTIQKLGMSYITGAKLECDSLQHIRDLLGSFEFVVSDAQGSHLPYAAYCGCKVAILPPYYQRLWENIKDHPHMQKHPSMKDNLVYYTAENMHSRMPWMFPASLNDAICPKEWADDLLGVTERKSSEELARLLGWSADAPECGSIPYPGAAEILGAVNPNLEHLESLRRIEKQSQEIVELKLECKALRAEAKRNQKRTDSYQPFAQSTSARLARGFYSIEKRLRAWFKIDVRKLQR